MWKYWMWKYWSSDVEVLVPGCVKSGLEMRRRMSNIFEKYEAHGWLYWQTCSLSEIMIFWWNPFLRLTVSFLPAMQVCWWPWNNESKYKLSYPEQCHNHYLFCIVLGYFDGAPTAYIFLTFIINQVKSMVLFSSYFLLIFFLFSIIRVVTAILKLWLNYKLTFLIQMKDQ